MTRPRSLLWLCLFVLAVLVLSACSDSTDEAGDTTAVPTTTAATTTTSAETGVALPGPGEPWDVLFLAADYLYPVSVADMYAEAAADALGVEVRTTYVPGQINYSTYLLKHLKNERFPPVGELVQQAEIIVLFPRFDETEYVGSAAEDTAHLYSDYTLCTWDVSRDSGDGRPIGDRAGQPGTPPAFDGSADYWDPYREDLDEIYAEIWGLRQGLPTVLITLDWVNPWLPRQRDAGIEAECTEFWESWSTQHREAAADNGSTMVSVYDVFNGTNHEVDPGETGYTGPTGDEPDIPWFLTNKTGLAQIAEALAAVGFEPLTAP